MEIRDHSIIYVCFIESEEEFTSREDSTEDSESSEDSEDESYDSKSNLNQGYGFRGVIKQGKYWVARGRIDGKDTHFASRTTEEACAEATRIKIKELRSAGKKVANNYGFPLVK